MAHRAARMTTAATALAIAAALAGCGSSSGKASAAADFPNPVDIIKKINACTLAPGVTQGDVGIDGSFKTADCTTDQQTIITVNTFKDKDALAASLAMHPSGDGSRTVVGDNFAVYLTAPMDINGTGIVFDPTPEAVQAAVGGRIQ